MRVISLCYPPRNTILEKILIENKPLFLKGSSRKPSSVSYLEYLLFLPRSPTGVLVHCIFILFLTRLYIPFRDKVLPGGLRIPHRPQNIVKFNVFIKKGIKGNLLCLG